MTDEFIPVADDDIGDRPVDELNDIAAAAYALLDVAGTRPAPDEPTDPVCPDHAMSEHTDANVIYGG